MTKTSDKTRAMEVARTIRSQIQTGVLWALGASDLWATITEHGNPALQFKARIIPKGQTKARVMTVVIELTPMDLYDITVTYIKKKASRFEAPVKVLHEEHTEVDVSILNAVLLSLDKEG